MKLFIFIALLAMLVTVVSAWSKEDYEIFDLVAALEAAEGKGTNFYSWLDVPSTATLTQINKAYRKKSLQLHPDKNPGVKGIHERFARLGVIASILKDSEGRKRYDFFYANGIPKWRGTGYYYSRFRPGLGTVLIFLAVLTSGLQYLVQNMNYKRDLQRIEQTIRSARLAAWGQKMEPLQGKRKVKVNIGGGPRLDEDGNIVPGKILDMIVEREDVYILDPSGSMHHLDTSSATPAAISRTWFIALLINVTHRLFLPKKNLQEADEQGLSALDMDDGSDSPGSETVTPDGSTEGKENLQASRAAAVKAGGRRRKALRK